MVPVRPAPGYHSPTAAQECKDAYEHKLLMFPILHTTSPKNFRRLSAHQSFLGHSFPRHVTLPQYTRLPLLSLPPLHHKRYTQFLLLRHVEADQRYHGGLSFGVTEGYSSPSPASFSGVRVGGLGGAAVTGWGYRRRPRHEGNRSQWCLQRCSWKRRRGSPTRRQRWGRNTRSKRTNVVECCVNRFNS